MKATGIVRRIDDLGRVVIPQEVRRTLGIREGDPIEIFIGDRGVVTFKKYNPCHEVECAAVLKGLYYSVTKNKEVGKAAIYGTDEAMICRNNISFPNFLTTRADECLELENYTVYTIKGEGDILGFLAVENDSEVIKTLVANTESILRQLEY